MTRSAPATSADARPSSSPAADALRVLAMDAVQQAASGHPGMPMGMADVAEVLWNRFLRHHPADPSWPDRDRFVLSNGHGSMLLYALLHLSGYDLSMEELRRFRRMHSRTPGHPERGRTPGVETTTGPLGQGLANAVGMALAERLLAAEFNRPGFEVVDHRTYAFVGDGCLMEGISHEAASLAGTLRLGKLICFWDDNGISIDGAVAGWCADDTPARFEGYGWHVVRQVDGHDPASVMAAVKAAQREAARPSLICCRTVIARGAPGAEGTPEAHGAPLGAAEVAAARANLGWPHPPFEIPEAVARTWDARERGARMAAHWRQRFQAYELAHPELAAELSRRMAGDLPDGFAARMDAALAAAASRAEPMATRKASQRALEAFAPALPELVGGSADLTSSNLTWWIGARPVAAGTGGNYLHYGVREFAMAAIMNGMVLHGGLIPFGGTFLAFSDYARPALRLAALMGLRSIFVFTHDSIAVGEDGPTHQPIEQAASLRLIPNMDVWRPADSVETLAAWRAALERRDGPSCLLLSRQGLPFQRRAPGTLDQVARGGYVLAEAEGGAPRAVILATGSEVQLAVEARQALAADGFPVRVVSMPCCGAFERQDPAWRAAVLPPGVPRVAVEAGRGDFWRKYVGLEGEVVGIDTFGESGPAADVARHFGFTPERVEAAVKAVLRR